MPEIVGTLKTPRLASAPGSPVAGQMYYDTTTNKLYWWNGTIWVDATGGGGGGGATVNAGVMYLTGSGSTVNIAGVWVNVPIPATGCVIEPSDAFSIVAGAVVVKDAGWYHASVSIGNIVSASNALFVALSSLITPGDGDIANAAAPGSSFNRIGCDGAIKLQAGAKVYVHAYSGSPSPVNTAILQFSIERIGGPQGATGATGGNATVPMDTWHQIGAAGEPAFTNSWTNYGTGYHTAAFRKDPLGRVALRGQLTGGTSGTVAFTLPVLYRPSKNVRTWSMAGGQDSTVWSQINIYADGTVMVWGTPWPMSLDQIEFDTDSVIAMPTGPQGPMGPAGGTMGAASYNQSGWSDTSVSLVAGVWKTIKCSQTTALIDPVGTFTVQTDGSIMVNQTGWYQINASVYAGVNQDSCLSVSLGGSSDAEGYWALSTSRGGAASPNTGTPVATVSAAPYITSGTKIYVNGYCNVALASVNLRYFSIARLGGAQGPAGGAANAIKQAYTAGVHTVDRDFNPASTTLNELANVMATLIDDLKTYGLISP